MSGERQSLRFEGRDARRLCWACGLGALFWLLLPAPNRGRAETPSSVSFELHSSAFEVGAAIPRRYSCQGADRSPPLSWSGAPVATRSFVLMVYDPDAPDPAAPRVTWVHWLLYDLPPDSDSLPEGAGSEPAPPGARPARNSWHRIGYGGPCPPIGRHRYFFELYALDRLLGEGPGSEAEGKRALERAMRGHVLARAELMGIYQKER